MARPSKRQQLVERGTETLRCRGYHGASVRDLVAAAEVPLGTFTNHFPSKDDFVLAAVDHYFADVESLMDKTVRNQALPPLRRLRSYFTAIMERFRGRHWQHGCLVGNLSLESPEHSDVLRQHLDELFRRWRDPFAECISDAQRAGEVRKDLDPATLADFLIASWQGAILRMKVERTPAALERFIDIVFTSLLTSKERP